MNITEALTQLKAFARQDGAILALVWITSFLLMMYAPQNPLSNLVALSTPFVVFWRLRHFRNYALSGIISFRRALAYSFYTFFYASLIFALVQYLYLRFVDGTTLNMLLAQSMETFTPLYADMGMSEEAIKESARMLESMNPIEQTLLFFSQNILVGGILSLPIAAIGKKNS